jgi:hypothetical protein
MIFLYAYLLRAADRSSPIFAAVEKVDKRSWGRQRAGAGRGNLKLVDFVIEAEGWMKLG